MENFSDRLDQAIREWGSYPKLAKLTGLNTQSLYNYGSGENSPTMETMRILLSIKNILDMIETKVQIWFH